MLLIFLRIILTSCPNCCVLGLLAAYVPLFLFLTDQFQIAKLFLALNYFQVFFFKKRKEKERTKQIDLQVFNMSVIRQFCMVL